MFVVLHGSKIVCLILCLSNIVFSFMFSSVLQFNVVVKKNQIFDVYPLKTSSQSNTYRKTFSHLHVLDRPVISVSSSSYSGVERPALLLDHLVQFLLKIRFSPINSLVPFKLFMKYT